MTPSSRVGYPIKDAIAVLEGTYDRVSREQRDELGVIVGLLHAVDRAESEWMGLPHALPTDVPDALKAVIDEVRFRLDIVELIPGTEPQQQFFRRALCSALALATCRHLVMEGAGRVRGGRRESSAEDLAMAAGFVASRYYGGRGPAGGAGAAIQDAHRIGSIGGSWASVILDGAP